jgi:hypothetical protein
MEVTTAVACTGDVEALPPVDARVPTVVALGVTGIFGQPGGIFLFPPLSNARTILL